MGPPIRWVARSGHRHIISPPSRATDATRTRTAADHPLKGLLIVTRVGTQVQLDDALLGRIDDLARQLGRSRDELIEDSLRREVAGRSLERLFVRTSEEDELTPDQAATLAYTELDALRADQDDSTRSG